MDGQRCNQAFNRVNQFLPFFLGGAALLTGLGFVFNSIFCMS